MQLYAYVYWSNKTELIVHFKAYRNNSFKIQYAVAWCQWLK